mmetsp:Transcript_24390/g.47342  ORF Transcript_24390/g.47342 Transcript_24390/m.47342 type:complete len:195 (+) Transcript_24390:28-612(+)|eukprot:CAMPEP_0173381124 /NCGR_PEP_ID=MMETSP1356-20130122/3595_1 /TAXON_ID=77927 ORGANISM="Hemiselmis virescens, Strain PCC157" /NCGR_SAMPLE_ID=MMETSP1356 /ASSEMBLY_ACC=CAM_ASM_000847 /LENGTH=194 /DNA_ID=CAMNT_0014334875 /DNA_START=10 /DNA_END=594 /DNA_ORIENTATION=-
MVSWMTRVRAKLGGKPAATTWDEVAEEVTQHGTAPGGGERAQHITTAALPGSDHNASSRRPLGCHALPLGPEAAARLCGGRHPPSTSRQGFLFESFNEDEEEEEEGANNDEHQVCSAHSHRGSTASAPLPMAAPRGERSGKHTHTAGGDRPAPERDEGDAARSAAPTPSTSYTMASQRDLQGLYAGPKAASVDL